MLFTRNVDVSIGDPQGGISAPVQALAQAVDASGVRAKAVPDILSREWSKFAGWVGFVGVALTARTVSWKYLSDPDAALVLVRLVREVRELASRAGVQLTDESMFPVATLSIGPEDAAVRVLNEIGRQFRDNAPKHRLSTLQDAEAGRPLEVEETLGFAARWAAEERLSLPLLDAFYHLAAAIDRTSRQ